MIKNIKKDSSQCEKYKEVLGIALGHLPIFGKGIYLSDRALSRLPRLNKPTYSIIEEKEVLEMLKVKVN